MNAFNINTGLGPIRDYKILRGNTSVMGINSVRVLQRFSIRRPTNLKTFRVKDFGFVSTEHKREISPLRAHSRSTLGSRHRRRLTAFHSRYMRYRTHPAEARFMKGAS